MTDFSGKWILDRTRSSSPADVLDVQGAGWFMKQAAAAVSLDVDITQTGSGEHTVITTRTITGEQAMTIDGVEREYPRKLIGDSVFITAKWGPEETLIVHHRHSSGSWTQDGVWELSDAGKTRTQKIHVKGPQKEGDFAMIFTKA
ncbi:hypothetical protein SeMB42_g06298 [Synchytrium endobioticum]|uniref:Lipocalin-like domain-containing protein n=1 Tax=Synchytrium endobioticum TaxID=286115 RepID=A0A507CMA7_9FUNG|nr:hypothetical protein SeMB42_g06298 [Synchytrium endobioticum]TPX47064.1 hypothetical protein SeLEV6574_g02850 [Synchytrium endobioticum]